MSEAIDAVVLGLSPRNMKTLRWNRRFSGYPNQGFQGYTPARAWVKHITGRKMKVPGLPTDGRSIVLLCGFGAAMAYGLSGLMGGDVLGWAYVGAAILGCLFLQARLFPTAIWLAVAAAGGGAVLQGNLAGWIECCLGALLAIVAALPVPTRDREIDAVESDARPGSAEVIESTPAVTIGTEAGHEQLVIRSIGKLRLLVGTRDLASGLEDKSVLAFLFAYLLARAATTDSQVVRSALGDELSPGISAANQLQRLRKQLYDLQRAIAPEIAALVRSNRSRVWLDLDGVDFDVYALRDLVKRVKQGGSLLSEGLALEVGQVLEQTEGPEFLAGFEELEHKINQGRGSASELVAGIRRELAGMRAELTRSLAEYHHAQGRPLAAIPPLRQALDSQPDRQDLARLLVAAYMQTGQTARADEALRTFDLKE
jgi:DNA-binding SARP family transcriptional activator